MNDAANQCIDTPQWIGHRAAGLVEEYLRLLLTWFLVRAGLARAWPSPMGQEQ